MANYIYTQTHTMAPRKTAMNKATKSINDMLLKKGFDPNDLDVDVVVSIDGTDYIVREKGDVKFFDVEDTELVAEAYEDKESGSEADTKEVVAESGNEDNVVIKEVKPKKSAASQPKKPRKTKKKEEHVEGAMEKPVEDEAKEGEDENDPQEEQKPLEKEGEAENDPQEEKPKKARKSKKQDKSDENDDKTEGKRRKRDPSKAKRHREKTCHNVFISEKMFMLQKTMPELSGRARFTQANKLWSGLSIEEKTKLKEHFLANKTIPIA